MTTTGCSPSRQFLTVTRVAFIDMLRSRTLRIASALILLVLPGLTFWLHTSDAAADVLAAAQQQVSSTPLGAAQRGLVVSLLVLFTVYIFILACGSIITTSVALERTSRVSIMVFRHVNPLTVVMARLTALMAAVLGLLVGISAEACSLAVLDLLPLSGLARMLGLSSLSASQWGLAVLCACSGVILFAILYAAVGLFVREPAQLQYAQFPVSLVLVLVFVLSYIAVLNPSSSLATAAALFPLSAPMVESGRIIADQSTPLEPWGAALGALILLGIVAAVIARIVVPRTVGRYSTTAGSRRPRPRHRH